MEVIIAGGGSIGLLVGSFLSEAGMDVTFFVEEKNKRLDSRGRYSTH